MAHEWLRSWNRLPEKERRSEPVTDQDLAELAIAHLNIKVRARALESYVAGCRARSHFKLELFCSVD